MQQTTYTMRVLVPEEGKYLTQAADDIELSDRVITANKLYLSAQQSPEDWKEISAAEAEALLAEQKALEAKAAE